MKNSKQMATIELSQEEIDILFKLVRYKKSYDKRSLLYYKDGKQRGYIKRKENIDIKIEEYTHKCQVLDSLMERLKSIKEDEDDDNPAYVIGSNHRQGTD